MSKFLENQSLPYLQTLSHILGRPLTFVDLEATGLVHERHFSIIEIGLVSISPNNIIEKSSLVDPLIPIPDYITEITGITNQMVKGQKTFKEFNTFFQKLSVNHIFCGFNSKSYDSTGIEKMSKKYNTFYTFEDQIDIRYLFLRNRNALLGTKSQKGSLTEASDFYKVKVHGGTAHRAAYDIALTALLAEKMLATHGLSTLLPDIEKFKCSTTKQKFRNYITTLKP